jgi:hypothetical protein
MNKIVYIYPQYATRYSPINQNSIKTRDTPLLSTVGDMFDKDKALPLQICMLHLIWVNKQFEQ